MHVHTALPQPVSVHIQCSSCSHVGPSPLCFRYPRTFGTAQVVRSAQVLCFARTCARTGARAPGQRTANRQNSSCPSTGALCLVRRAACTLHALEGGCRESLPGPERPPEHKALGDYLGSTFLEEDSWAKNPLPPESIFIHAVCANARLLAEMKE